MVNKQALINGLSNYVHQYVLPSITDVWNRRILDGIVDLMVMHPEYFDRVMKKYPLVDMFCENGEYDVDLIEEMLLNNIDHYGSINVEILNGHYTFDADDIRKLRQMI